MTSFILTAALLSVFILLLIARPFLVGVRGAPSPDMAQLNAGVLRDEIRALEQEHARGALSAAEFAAAQDEVHRRLLEETPAEAGPARATRPARWTLIPLVVLFPLAAAGIYALLGTPAAVRGVQPAAMAGNGSPDVEKMVATLAAKLEAHPDNPEGWAMLGRSYKVMGRFDEAVAAFARVGPKLEQNATWLAEYADVLGMQAGGKLVGKPEAMAKLALQREPENLLALMLVGSAAFERKDYAVAVEILQRALPQVPPDSDDGRFLKEAINRARIQMGAAPLPEASGALASDTPPSNAPAANGRVLALAIGVAPALKREVAGKTLFVIARAPGERMPIAVVKRSAESLPATITLDDSASLNASRLLSSIPKLEIEARVSTSGMPQAASGDLFGIAQVADATVSALAITVDQRRP